MYHRASTADVGCGKSKRERDIESLARIILPLKALRITLLFLFFRSLQNSDTILSFAPLKNVLFVQVKKKTEPSSKKNAKRKQKGEQNWEHELQKLRNVKRWECRCSETQQVQFTFGITRRNLCLHAWAKRNEITPYFAIKHTVEKLERCPTTADTQLNKAKGKEKGRGKENLMHPTNCRPHISTNKNSHTYTHRERDKKKAQRLSTLFSPFVKRGGEGEGSTQNVKGRVGEKEGTLGTPTLAFTLRDTEGGGWRKRVVVDEIHLLEEHP